MYNNAGTGNADLYRLTAFMSGNQTQWTLYCVLKGFALRRPKG